MKRADSLIVDDLCQENRAILRLAWTQGLVVLIIVALIASPCGAAQPAHTDSTPLLKLAASKFPDLTKAERAMLRFMEVGNIDRGEIAVAGSSGNPDDPSNDPKGATAWGHDRDIRASLVRWLITDRGAIGMEDVGGIRILGARIVQGLDLSHLHVSYSIVMHRCVFSDRLKLVATELPYLDLNGSHTGEIDAKGIIVHSDLDLGSGFRASGETVLESAKIEGDLNCGGGHFHKSKVAMPSSFYLFQPAIDATTAVVKGSASFCCGFESNGVVGIAASSLGGLDAYGGNFLNPNGLAFFAASAVISGDAFVGAMRPELGTFVANGEVNFTNAHFKSLLTVSHAHFLGARGETHGFVAPGLVVDGLMVWHAVELSNAAPLDLRGAKVSVLLDEEKSWPEYESLRIDGLTYTVLGPPSDVAIRLRWLGLQGLGFHPQPYNELAAFYKRGGSDSEAIQVLVAKEDARYSSYGWLGWFWGGFLKYTIAYGHRPLLAVFWSLAVVLLGWLLVSAGSRAGLMCETWPENNPTEARKRYERLSPLLYSLDVFLPFVNLHQEHYWWADGDADGQFAILGREIHISGGMLRRYLWLQIIAGWLLSAIFIAGITGLIRND